MRGCGVDGWRAGHRRLPQAVKPSPDSTSFWVLHRNPIWGRGRGLEDEEEDVIMVVEEKEGDGFRRRKGTIAEKSIMAYSLKRFDE